MHFFMKNKIKLVRIIGQKNRLKLQRLTKGWMSQLWFGEQCKMSDKKIYNMI